MRTAARVDFPACHRGRMFAYYAHIFGILWRPTFLLSFVDAVANLSEVSAKIATSAVRLMEFAPSGNFHISLLGRVKDKEANI